MAKMGKFSANDLKKLQKKLNKLEQKNVDAFIEECAKELAARLLAKVIKRTPVRQYPKSSGKKGGTLRRGWTSNNSTGATAATAYADSLKINHFGDTFVVEIENPVEYASYVEYGHRTKDHKGWVNGRFILTISVQEVQDIAPNVLAKNVEKYLGECFK
jgi:hypothetical protein